ncbi:MAG: hypothetical protein R3F54_02590 [Alphaproteobacteria bacterium]
MTAGHHLQTAARLVDDFNLDLSAAPSRGSRQSEGATIGCAGASIVNPSTGDLLLTGALDVLADQPPPR